jgi:energy-coupling factor transporter ATP-binding protein EcfA2
MVSIDVKGLCVSRGGTQILKDLSFSVARGSFTVLSGPSGCGKSTVLLAVQGLIGEHEDAQATGEITVNGNLVTLQKRVDSLISHSGYLMQNVDAQIVNLRSEDELVFGMENRGFAREEMQQRSREYVERFALEPTKEVLHLSGGQKQRLLIASCLVTGHDVLLLDEPFANLDHVGVANLVAALQACCKQGTTVLCVEHRLEEVCKFADALLWLEDGQLTEFRGDQIVEYAQQKASILNRDLGWNTKPGELLLRVAGLSARRGKTPVLAGIDLELPENSSTLLLGRNGCGKTTLMRVLCGLSPRRQFHAETLSLQGKDHSNAIAYRRLRRKVGFVFQNPVHQLFMKTVREELVLRSAKAREVETVMEVFGIGHLESRHPYSLSMGEKRRVSVAAAAISESRLLLLDEPTIGQDYENLLQMAKSLRELQGQTGNTLLVSTHDQLAARLFGGQAIQL